MFSDTSKCYCGVVPVRVPTCHGMQSWYTRIFNTRYDTKKVVVIHDCWRQSVVIHVLQVGFIANSLADALGAVMATSRWRVCGALWSQLVVLLVTAVSVINSSGCMMGLLVLVVGLGALFIWWYDVFIDHQKDDLSYLQRGIQLARRYVRMQQDAADLLTRWNVPTEHPAWRYTDTTSGFGPLLLAMQQREQELCKLFGMLPVG